MTESFDAVLADMRAKWNRGDGFNIIDLDRLAAAHAAELIAARPLFSYRHFKARAEAAEQDARLRWAASDLALKALGADGGSASG